MSVHGAFGIHYILILIRVIDFYVKQPQYYAMICKSNDDLVKMKKSDNDEEIRIIQETLNYAKRVSFFLVKCGQLSCFILAVLNLINVQFNPLNLINVSIFCETYLKL